MLIELLFVFQKNQMPSSEGQEGQSDTFKFKKREATGVVGS